MNGNRARDQAGDGDAGRTATGAATTPCRRIVVINGKGGCGKTTVATNLAVCYAQRGWQPALFDHDPQTSSSRWLRSRSDSAPTIHGIGVLERQSLGVTRSWQLRVPEHTDRIIDDTPAGLSGLDVADHVQGADTVLIPVLPSSIDIGAGADFIRDLLLKSGIQRGGRGTRIGIVANRLKERTLALESLERFLRSLGIPVVARLRDTQNYLHAAEQGAGIVELGVRSHTIQRETRAWQGLMEWLEGAGGSRGDSASGEAQGAASRARGVDGVTASDPGSRYTPGHES